jgi:hypothetical protein
LGQLQDLQSRQLLDPLNRLKTGALLQENGEKLFSGPERQHPHQYPLFYPEMQEEENKGPSLYE